MLLKFKEVLFDDWEDNTEDGERSIWGEVCYKCASKYRRLKPYIDDGGCGACSVCGCDYVNADDPNGQEHNHYYIDFPVGEVEFISE